MAKTSSICTTFAIVVGIASATLALDHTMVLNRLRDTDGRKAALAEWGPALKTATGEDNPALFRFLLELDPLWGPDHKLRKEVSSKLVARMKAVNEGTLAKWQSAFEKATGYKPTKLNTLVLIVLLDRMFDNATLNEQAAASLHKRLESLPQEATKQWSDVSKQERHAATAQLITLDLSFTQDIFDEARFMELWCARAINDKAVGGTPPGASGSAGAKIPPCIIQIESEGDLTECRKMHRPDAVCGCISCVMDAVVRSICTQRGVYLRGSSTDAAPSTAIRLRISCKAEPIAAQYVAYGGKPPDWFGSGRLFTGARVEGTMIAEIEGQRKSRVFKGTIEPPRYPGGGPKARPEVPFVGTLVVKALFLENVVELLNASAGWGQLQSLHDVVVDPNVRCSLIEWELVQRQAALALSERTAQAKPLLLKTLEDASEKRVQENILSVFYFAKDTAVLRDLSSDARSSVRERCEYLLETLERENRSSSP